MSTTFKEVKDWEEAVALAGARLLVGPEFCQYRPAFWWAGADRDEWEARRGVLGVRDD